MEAVVKRMHVELGSSILNLHHVTTICVIIEIISKHFYPPTCNYTITYNQP